MLGKVKAKATNGHLLQLLAKAMMMPVTEVVHHTPHHREDMPSLMCCSVCSPLGPRCGIVRDVRLLWLSILFWIARILQQLHICQPQGFHWGVPQSSKSCTEWRRSHCKFFELKKTNSISWHFEEFLNWWVKITIWKSEALSIDGSAASTTRFTSESFNFKPWSRGKTCDKAN